VLLSALMLEKMKSKNCKVSILNLHILSQYGSVKMGQEIWIFGPVALS